MNAANTPSEPRPGAGLRFGGWSDYQEWALHDFRRRTPSDGAANRRAPRSSVEMLSDVVPITVTDEDFGSSTRTACLVVPPPQDGEVEMNGDAEPGIGRERVESEDDEAMLVRPYVRASGRAETAHDLEFETVLTATGMHLAWTGERELNDDQLIICGHCESPRSVAEIATAINVPVGVAKVLIGDAIDQGLLVLHEPTPTVDGHVPLELLKRVHAGIAKLA